MRLVTLKAHSTEDLNVFVNYWKRFYDFPNDKLYSENIIHTRFDDIHIRKLFEWKNAMPLEGSGGKFRSLEEKVLTKLNRINQYKVSDLIDFDQFNDDFKDISVVWRVFILHIIKPQHYPIYDQHVHRAFEFIHDGKWDDIKNTMQDKVKIEFYKEKYLPFIDQHRDINLKELDEAFFSFGRFLNTKKQQLVFAESKIM